MIDRPYDPDPENPTPQQSSIRWHLTRTVSLIFVVAMLAAFAGVSLFIRQAEETIWLARQREAASGAARAVGSFMDQIWGFLHLVGTLGTDYLSDNQDALEKLIAQNAAIIEAVRVDGEGRIVAGAQQVDDAVLLNLPAIANTSWFLTTRYGAPYVSEVQFSATDEPYLIVAVPAVDGGSVAARLRMDTLWDIVAALEFGKSGIAYVVDAAGYVVAHPDPGVVLTGTTIEGRPEMQGATTSTSGQWRGTYRAFDGREVLGYAVPIPGSTWWVFAEVSESEATTVARNAMITLGAGLIILGAVMTGLTQITLRQLVLDPLEGLNAGVERVAQGEFSYRLQSIRADEIGQVADAFNTMTARLQEREAALGQARDEALAASRFKSTLLANVSHDLRTPLSGILGYGEMLDEGDFGALSKDQAVAVDRILSNTRRLIAMINSMLDQALIEAGQIAIANEPFDAAKLLDDVNNILSFVAEQRGIELFAMLDPELPDPLYGDYPRLHQILMNLVSNALKFTTQGKVEMRIKRWDQTNYCLEVADTGSGIPPEAQQFIFDPYRPIDTDTAREYSGVGLGLSIVRQLVMLMHGDIRLVSRVGKGSTFTIVLPLTVPETEIEEADVQIQSPQ